MIHVNAMGDACPIPVAKTKNAIAQLGGPGAVETLVDNEIAVQNLTKMANQKGYAVRSEKLEPGKFRVVMTVGEPAEAETVAEEEACLVVPGSKQKNTVVVLSASTMGTGSDELGTALMKGFVYALCQQDTLPSTVLLYNGGAALSCEGSASLEDLKSLEAQGVEILTCGTCLNYYGLTEKLRVGQVTNMYVIAEKMMLADCIVRP